MATVIPESKIAPLCTCPFNLRGSASLREPAAPMIHIQRYGSRNWAVYVGGTLLVVAVYKKGAIAVKNALESAACLTVLPTPARETPADIAA